MTTLPELLVPAADKTKLSTALLYGADAVYLGGHALNLRAKTGGFSFSELHEAVLQAHQHGARVYFTLNLLAWEEQLPLVKEYLNALSESGVDALIIADPGILALAQECAPHIPIHLSTQANTSNSEAARFWHKQGVSRVNLARELGGKRIRDVVQHTKDLELEVFVHGAMCMALSGRCLLSAYMNKRSANQGLCTHPCRFDYAVTGLRLEEKMRPGQALWEIEENGPYTQIMAAEDLCLVSALQWFAKVGVHSLKIEGRMKTTSYLAQVTDVYRTALDDLAAKNFRPALYIHELRQTATRALTTGFFAPRRKTLAEPLPHEERQNILACIEEELRPGFWKIAVKHRFQRDEHLEILAPGLHRPLVAPGEYSLEKENGTQLTAGQSGVKIILRAEHPDLRSGLFLRQSPALLPRYVTDAWSRA